MSRTTLIIASILMPVYAVFAVDLVGISKTGAPGEAGTNITSVSSLNVSSSTFTGGSVVSNTVGGIYLNGNEGIVVNNAGAVTLSGSTFSGSDGGSGNSSSVARMQSLGGHGIDLRGDFTVAPISGGVRATGGDGATLRNGGGTARAYGGDGLYVNSTATYNLIFNGGIFTGGDGGVAEFNSAQVNDADDGHNGTAYLGEYLGQIGGILGAHGGYGVRIYNEEFIQYGSMLEINSGTFNGGDGGSSVNSNADGDSNADGGHAVFTDYIDVQIDGGTFTGGDAGTANGVVGEDGYGVKVRDGNLTVTGGSFLGNGLWHESHYYDSVATISGGTFGNVMLVARYDEFYNLIRQSSSEITGGTFNNVTMFASGAATNNSTISGVSIKQLGFAGTEDGSINIIHLDPTTSISSIYQNGGTANLNQWNAAQVANTTIAEGTMNLNDGHLLNGNLTLIATNANANFDGDLSVVNGGMLKLGLGAVSAPSVQIKDGAVIESGFDGNMVGSISTAGNLSLAQGAEWVLNAGTNTVALNQQFDLATAGSITTNGFTNKDLRFSGTAGEAGWLGGLDLAIVNNTTLQATYNEATLDVALGVAGDDSDFGQAMAALSKTVTPGSDSYNTLKLLTPSQEQGAMLMTNAYVRTPEMASTLMGLQAVFADQIKDRTRSNLGQMGVGYPAELRPDGAGAWDSVRKISDQAERGMNTDSLRAFSDRMEGSMGADQVSAAVDAVTPDVAANNIGLPVDYQVWGRGYGSFAEQDERDGVAGYDATIAGGIIGMDRRMNNMLLGVAAGYTRTVLEGNEGQDGEADTGNIAAYFAAHGENLFFDLNANYGFNAVETEYNALGYTGDYDANTLGIYVGGGYAMPIAKGIVFTPEASMLFSYYDRESYTERSALYPDKKWDAYDQWTPLSSVGATLSMVSKIDLADLEIAMVPEVRAHWLHDFNADMDQETYTMNDISGIGATLLAREEDLAKIGAGIRMTKWRSDATEFGLDVDATLGDDYTAYIVSGKLMHRF